MHIDWTTLALQTINVLVLLWLLRRYLFRPIADIIAARRQAADSMLADAATARTAAEAHEAALAERARGMVAEAAQMHASAQADAAAERGRLLAEAEADITRIRNEAAAAIRRERTAQRRTLEVEAERLAVTVAERLLQRLPGAAATTAMLSSLESVLAALPLDQRQGLAASAAPLAVVSATPLSESERTECAAVLARLLDPSPPLRFLTEPSLIAGIELRGPHAVLRHSWQAELERVGRALEREDAGVEPLLA